MKAALFAIGGILSGWLLKFLKFLGGVVLRGLGTILSFFGLYVPIIYLLFGLVLNIAFKFNPFGGDVNGKLYVLGLVECLICTVIICVRNLVARPIQSVFAFLKGHSSGRSGGRRDAPETPEVYRSSVRPDLIVYEYRNRYDLFKDENGRLRFLRTEYK